MDLINFFRNFNDLLRDYFKVNDLDFNSFVAGIMFSSFYGGKDG